MTTLLMQTYQTEDDYWEIRTFLRELFLSNSRHRIGWQVTRFDYWRWHMVENVGVVDSLENAIYLWRDDASRIQAMLIADHKHDVFLNVHPNVKTMDLERQMLQIAEERLGTRGKKFFVFAHELDLQRQELLRQRGYSEIGGYLEYQWHRNLTQPLPTVAIADGYTIRAIGDIDELPARSWASWRAFHPDEPDSDYGGWEWSLNWRRAPLYRRDLDIVAVAPDGTIAGYVILWFDDVTRTALFDPVAVMPEHQRRGLAPAMMVEAMRRAHAMGATLATVSGYETGANELYKSVLSADGKINTPWMKVL